MISRVGLLAALAAAVLLHAGTASGGNAADAAQVIEAMESKGAHAAGKIYVWRVTEPKVELYRREALITYTNRGCFQDADGTNGT